MRWVPDPTGRFPKRPYYEEGELDRLCEQTISDFLLDRHGKVLLPIPTDDLTVLIERDAEDLDLYADLSGEGGEAQGVTHFFPGEKPRVKIAREISEQEHRENRLRTRSPTSTGTSSATLPSTTWRPRPRCFRNSTSSVPRQSVTATRSLGREPRIGWNGRPATPAARC